MRIVPELVCACNRNEVSAGIPSVIEPELVLARQSTDGVPVISMLALAVVALIPPFRSADVARP